MSGLRVSLLGSPHLECDGKPVQVERRKSLALLAYLAVSGQPEDRGALAALLWPDMDRGRALASLRRALLDLTKAFEGRFLATDRKTIGLELGDEVWVDVRRFEDLLNRSSGEGGQTILESLSQAAELYRGDFLAGLTLPDSEPFDEWQFWQSERLRQELSSALQQLIEGRREQGEYSSAIQAVHRLLSLDPLAEKVHRRLMRLYAESGQRSAAVRQYEKCAEVLEDQLQVTPEPETTELFQAIRKGRVGGPAATEPKADSEPEFEARQSSGPEQTAPSRSAPIRLPFPTTPFVGRQSDLADIEEHLEDPNCRLLTLVGPGGIGKTRLALEAARQQSGRPRSGPVHFVSLAAATPALATSTIADGLQIALDPQGDPETQLLNYLATSRMLMVLDNFEHIVERADLVAAILTSAPDVKILITSREGLNLQGEWLMEVAGLDVPEDSVDVHPEDFSAVQLFQEAARRARSGFSLTADNLSDVVEICRLVNGLPLGIELAANWMRILSCSEICREIRDNLDFLSSDLRNLPERHRSLRAVFTSSAQLLGDREREAFQRLSVFQGGFDRQAAERVANASLPLLLDLVNKSLLAKAASSRFVMHEMLRQFASELLAKGDEKNRAIRDRHSRYYLEFLVHRGENLRGDRQQQALEAIHPEMENIRSAWNWAVKRRHWERVDQSLEGIYRFCLLTSRILEMGEIFSSTLQSLSKQKETRLWARIVARQGRFFILSGRFDEARRMLEECLEVFRQSEEHHEIAFTLSNLGEICFHRGEFDQAAQMSKESAGRFRALGDRIGTANAMNLRGRIAAVRGNHEDSRRLFNQSLVIYQEVGAQDGIARCLNNLGNMAMFKQTFLEAIRMFQEGLEIYTRLGDRKGMAFCLNGLGIAFEESAQLEKARDFQQRALSLFRQIGYQDATARSLANLGRITFALGEFQKSGQYFGEALRTASAIQAVPTALLALMGLAQLLDQKGRKEKAWQLLQFIMAHPKLDSEASIQAREVLQSLQAGLPSEVREIARPPWPEEDLEALAREVMADLNLGPVATLDTRSA